MSLNHSIQLPLNADWDQWFLKQLAGTDLSEVAALGHDGLEEVAGSGGHEIRAWLIGHAAVGAPVVWTSYDPVPEWIIGMGIATTFPVD
jgi:2,3-dihydroxyphenylpropionate 1,2-dioxygenase